MVKNWTQALAIYKQHPVSCNGSRDSEEQSINTTAEEEVRVEWVGVPCADTTLQHVMATAGLMMSPEATRGNARLRLVLSLNTFFF